MKLSLLFVCLLLAARGHAQDLLFPPTWVLSPTFYAGGNFSASYCSLIKDGDEFAARSDAMEMARQEIEMYVEGFDPTNSTLSEQVAPKIYMNQSAIWEKESRERMFCVLASMRFDDMKIAIESNGNATTLSEIESRFDLLAKLSERGMLRERLADEEKIRGLEMKWQALWDLARITQNLLFSDAVITRQGSGFVLSARVKNNTGAHLSEFYVTIKTYKGARPIPLVVFSNESWAPTGGLMNGEEAWLEYSLKYRNDRLRDIFSPDLRIEVIATDLWDENGRRVGQYRDLDSPEWASSKIKRELDALKAKWRQP